LKDYYGIHHLYVILFLGNLKKRIESLSSSSDPRLSPAASRISKRELKVVEYDGPISFVTGYMNLKKRIEREK